MIALTKADLVDDAVSRLGEVVASMRTVVAGAQHSLAIALEMGNTWQRRADMSFGSTRKDASLFLAFDTFLGPVYLGSGYDTAGHSAYYLFLGRTF